MLSLIQILINEYHKQFNNNRVCVVPDGYIIRTTEQNIHIYTDRELINTLRYEIQEGKKKNGKKHNKI